MTAQALENTTKIKQGNQTTDKVMINALIKELDKFKARTLKVAIISIISFGASVGCAIIAWQTYQDLPSRIDIANIDIDVPTQIWGMDFENRPSSNDVKSLQDFSTNAEQAVLNIIKIMVSTLATIMLIFGGFQLLNGRAEVTEFATKAVICIVIISIPIIPIIMVGYSNKPNPSSKNLSKKEIISQLQSDDYDEFYKALPYIKSRNDDIAKYLEIQYKIKKELDISIDDKNFIENKIARKEFKHMPNSSAYLFSQASNNEYLLGMANSYKKGYYQDKKRKIIKYLIFSSILSFIFIAGILASIAMGKRLKTIDFAKKSLSRNV